MLLHGIIAPITTPFYPDGRVYFRKLEHNVDRYSRGPLAGIAVAEHPNIIGIKESGGNLDKIQRLVEETRHIQRETVVSETFAAITGRMQAASEKDAEKLVPVGSLVGGGPSSAATRPKSTLK